MRLAKVLALILTLGCMLALVSVSGAALNSPKVGASQISMSVGGGDVINRLHNGSIGGIVGDLEVTRWRGYKDLTPVVQENLRRNVGAGPGNVQLSGNVRASDPAGGALGITQSEVTVTADASGHVLVAWNDGAGFTAGSTLSSYAFSCDYGATFTDGGNVPLRTGTNQQAYGDCVVDNDAHGNFYLNSLYSTTSGPTFLDVAVWRGSFTGNCTFVWNTPVLAATGVSASNSLDKNWMAVDKSGDGHVYVAYARFLSSGVNEEEVTSADFGATFSAATTLRTGNGTSGYPSGVQLVIDQHNSTVYAMWEENGASISCTNDFSSIAYDGVGFSKSTNHGGTWSPAATVAVSTEQNDMGVGPGNIRDRFTNFPSVAIDNTNGPYKGSLYCVWTETSTWDTNAVVTSNVAENEAGGNATPGAAGVQTINVGQNATGLLNVSTDTFDYWKINLVAGQHLLLSLIPQGFNCGVTTTARNFRLRLYANPANQGVSPPDTLLSSSNRSGFVSNFAYDVHKTGVYVFRVQTLGTTSGNGTGLYVVRARTVTYSSPNPTTPVRDMRDVVEMHSRDGGATWSSKQVVNDAAPGFDEELPFAAVDSCGQVLVFYYDRRETDTPGNPLNGSFAQATDLYMNKSGNGGVTFGAGTRITTETNFFNNNTNAVPNMGDYNQACTGGNYVFAGWTDERISNAGVAVYSPGLTYATGSGPDAYIQAVVTGCSNATAVEVAGVVAEAGRGYVDIRWSAFLTGTARFQVYRSATLDGAYEAVSSEIASNGTSNYSFRDASALAGADYYYKVAYTDGVDWKYTAASHVQTPAAVFALRAVRPNPTTGPASIEYEIAHSGRATIEVYNTAGARVRTLLDASKQAGVGTVQFDGRDQAGNRLSAGAYFVRLTSAGQSLTQRVMLLH